MSNNKITRRQIVPNIFTLHNVLNEGNILDGQYISLDSSGPTQTIFSNQNGVDLMSSDINGLIFKSLDSLFNYAGKTYNDSNGNLIHRYESIKFENNNVDNIAIFNRNGNTEFYKEDGTASGPALSIGQEGMLISATTNSLQDSYMPRFIITGDSDITNVIIQDANVNIYKPNLNGKTFFINNNVGSEIIVLGDVDNTANETQIYLKDNNKQVGILAKEGLILKAASNPSNIYYAIIKTDNINAMLDSNYATVQIPLTYNNTLAVSVDNKFSDETGNIKLNSVPVFDEIQLNMTTSSTLYYYTLNLTTYKKFRIAPYLKINSVAGGAIQLALQYNDENNILQTLNLKDINGNFTNGTVGIYLYPVVDIYAMSDGVNVIYLIGSSAGTINYNIGFTIHQIN